MKKEFLILMSAILCFSCSNEELPNQEPKNDNIHTRAYSNDNTEKDSLKCAFASVLSKVIHERQDVREFLKDEAVKQFDKNYDILYAKIKNEKINGTSFRDILLSYSSDEIISDIEQKVPQLNILLPEIPMLEIYPEEYDSSDKEVPVAVSKKNETVLYYDGTCTNSLKKGEVPGFHIFVVNENSRVIVHPETRATGASFTFKSPNFDGTNKQTIQTRQIAQTRQSVETRSTNTTTRSVTEESSVVGQSAINAYQYFYKNDGSINSAALQRDYIYYNITPQRTSGSLNQNVSEYISFLEIDPKAYFKMSDQKNSDSTNDDPHIKENSVSQKKKDFTEAELIDKLWTKGAYDLRIEVVTSTKGNPQILHIPLKPNEIWNFNLKRDYRHSTLFRHSKYTYTINPDNFTAKRVYLTSNQISFGKWNLAEESIYRYVTFIEEDEDGLESEISYTYDMTKVNSDKFNGDVKLEVGLGESKLTGGTSTEVSSSTTTKESKTIKVRRNEKSDDLGSITIYFYNPIIEKKLSDGLYQIQAYSTGIVTFGITAF